MARNDLLLRFLGETEVLRGGVAVALPQSKKTRALLAYLAVAGGRHRRERLCSLLWDVADDPRGALRWSLSKLRAIVDEPGRERVSADRESVGFVASGARIDLLAVRQRISGGVDALPVDELRELAAEFRGEFLEALDLFDFHDFHAWCVAMREDARKARVSILGALVRRLEGNPAEALPFARALVQADPFAAAARAYLLRLLAADGRAREAADHYETARRFLEEADRPAAAMLAAAWETLRARARKSPEPADATPSAGPEVGRGPARPPIAGESPSVDEPPAAKSRDLPPFVGRDQEMSRFRELLDEVGASRRERNVLILGEPGIGKSRLLSRLVSEAHSRGGLVLAGRCFEAECSRPYGPWAEALRRLPPASMGEALAAALAPLLGGSPEDADGEGTREGLFGAVVDLVSARAAGPAPLVIAIDDLHWCDPASAELLHYVARMNQHRPVLVALAAREGELVDNDAVRRLLRGLRSEGSEEEVRLGPLGRGDVSALAQAIAPEMDADRLFEESRGNPLFAAELVRSGRPAGDDLPPRLRDVIRDRIDRLPPEPAEVLQWAAALGCGFSVDLLSRVMSLVPERLVVALEALERHSLLGAAAAGGKAGDCSFYHNLVRQVVYSSLSEPRRRVMHSKIARVLGESSRGGEGAADLAHHAALAGDPGTAAVACVAAGRHCLRIFAGEEALALSLRGTKLAEGLPEPDRTRRLIELAEVRLSARRPPAIGETAGEIEALAERAIDLGCVEHARLGFQILGWLRWEEGDAPGARRHLMRAEAVSRSGSERERAIAMGEAARCLALLENDLAQAEALVLEAGALSKRAGFDHAAIADALGMLRLHEGRLEEAADHFARGRSLARREADSMGEFLAIEHLIALEMERGDAAAARRLSADLVALGAKLREGSEEPFARAIEALTRASAGEDGAHDDLERALGDLRDADAKQRLAFVLVRASRLDLQLGDARRAQSRAEEALALAEAMRLPSDMALARVALVRAADAAGDVRAARTHRESLATTAGAILSAAARKAIEEMSAPKRRKPSRRRKAR